MKVSFDNDERCGSYANFCSFNRLGVELSSAGIYESFESPKSINWDYYGPYIKKAAAIREYEELVGIHVTTEGERKGIEIILKFKSNEKDN